MACRKTNRREVKRFVPAVALLIGIACPTGSFSASPKDSHPRDNLYSTHADWMMDHDKVSTSPDGRWNVRTRFIEGPGDGEDDEHVMLDVFKGSDRVMTKSIGPGVQTELLWAPDSHRFAITSSWGGASGSYYVLIFERTGESWRGRVRVQPFWKAYGYPHRCDVPERPNVGAILWVNSRRLVVAAETVAHSICDSMGTFKAYEYDAVSNRIVATYDQITAKRQFGPDLGAELRNADDGCIIDPRTCFIPNLHPGLKPKAR